MNDRIRELRKALNLSQTEFGDRIGMTRSMISNLELGAVSVADYVVSLLCKTFNTSEIWLRAGEGDMFNQGDDSILSHLADKYRLDPLEKSIVETFLTLPPDTRAAVTSFVTSLADKTAEARLRARLDEAIDEHERREKDMGMDA